MSISPMNIENNSRSFGLGNESQTRFGTNASGASERPQTRDAALDTLVKSMTNDKGQVNSDNPLVKMLSDFLEKALGSMLQQMGAGSGAQGAAQGTGASTVQNMSPEELKEALSGMIEQLLGGSAGAGGSSGAGGEDILSKLLGGLAQEKLNSLLQPSDEASNSGGATFDEKDKAILEEVAQFMDQHPEEFGSPHDADGKTKSWSDELNEVDDKGNPDFKLNSAEASAFQDAINMLGQSAASGSASSSGMLANSGLPISSGEGGGGGSAGGPGGGNFAGGNVSVTLSAEDFLKLMQGGTQGGASAQSQALSQDASQTAGSIMDKMFS
ncbi:harpin HrpZ family protein [Pseudomonas congelans]|uniref:harpin HrpZ family protein n=1 Tax=Pseudomonas congelans TaxID=200452 RepID=UPI001BDC5472|nr:harpin HrpZ family protein [Pseudomonas congelans]QVX09742.1 hypothetical protein DBV21_07585 [Pseudomonas congelans]